MMMRKALGGAVLAAILSVPAGALADDAPATASDESVQSYENTLTVRGYVRRPFLELTLRHYVPRGEENNSKIIRYAPNTLANWGGGFSWKGFGLSLGFNAPRSAKDENLYGKTEYRDFQLYYYGRRFGFDAHYQNYKGFYLLNSRAHGYDAGDPDTLRPDLAMRSAGFNVFYSFFDSFSFSAAFDQLERQVNSAWSPLVMVSGNRFMVRADRSLIPPAQEAFYGEFAGYRGGDYTGAAVSPGIAYTWIYREHFFLTAAGFMGAGWMKKEYTTALGDISDNEGFGKANLRLSLGYNQDSIFAGFLGTWDITASERTFGRRLDRELTEVIAVVINVELYAGVRI